MRFWDSSAIVPLVIAEPTSAQAEAWLAEDDEIIVWTLTPVELVSAFQRRLREGKLQEHEAIAAENLSLELLEAAHEITGVEPAKTIARRLLRTHVLRAADALQLAAALLWTETRPEGAIVHTFDRHLATAAVREGFRVVPAAAAD
jgi:hypothetical protein